MLLTKHITWQRYKKVWQMSSYIHTLNTNSLHVFTKSWCQDLQQMANSARTRKATFPNENVNTCPDTHTKSYVKMQHLKRWTKMSSVTIQHLSGHHLLGIILTLRASADGAPTQAGSWHKHFQQGSGVLHNISNAFMLLTSLTDNSPLVLNIISTHASV